MTQSLFSVSILILRRDCIILEKKFHWFQIPGREVVVNEAAFKGHGETNAEALYHVIHYY